MTSMKNYLSLLAALVLLIGINTGCGSKENKINWVESTGTITKSTQVNETNYDWTMEISTDKGPVSVNIPGPAPATIGKKVKLKYNQADPNSYQLLEELIKGI